MLDAAVPKTPDAAPLPISLAGVEVMLDPAGALWLPAHKVLIFSDLHFEKGSSYGRKGVFLPPYDTRSTLRLMADVIARYAPQKIVSLGDSFHDQEAEARMDAADADALARLTHKAQWVWILGNHDPAPPARFKGQAEEEITIGGLVLTHEPEEAASWHVAGHMHPCAKVSRNGRAIRRRCFMTDGTRLILPSFGAYTGGLNVLDAAYTPYFQSGYRVFMLGKGQVFQVPNRSLRPDGGGHFTYRQ